MGFVVLLIIEKYSGLVDREKDTASVGFKQAELTNYPAVNTTDTVII